MAAHANEQVSESIGHRVPGLSTTREIDVMLGGRSYSVVVGAGVRSRVTAIVNGLGARRVVVVSARPEDGLPELNVPTLRINARDGEENKTLTNVDALCRQFADFGLTRSDVVVACGGGTTTDTVGLAAALYHRGIAVVHIPTSLLAQVDASVGGKTAVNLPQGKNLVGAYWQPSAVLCDIDYLETLPEREWASGYGEIARAHFIGTGDLRTVSLTEQIARSVARKAEIVSLDEFDSGLRHTLNYGHTLGHALEKATNFRLRHGEAVAIGTVFAGRLAGTLGRIDTARVTEHLDVVSSYGLQASLPAEVDISELISLIGLDKKRRGSGLGFVLDGTSGVELVEDIDASIVRAELESMPRA